MMRGFSSTSGHNRSTGLHNCAKEANWKIGKDFDATVDFLDQSH